MRLRELFTCVWDALADVREERHRRKVLADERKHQAELASPLPELRSEAEELEVLAMGELVHAWRTGEVPIVVPEVVDEFKPGIYVYAEPIGPKLPTVDEQFAAFEADPLGAALPGAPAKSNPHFAEVLSGSDLPAQLVDDLERTGSWSRGFLAALARGER
jgi:hypothetical protein